MLYMILQSWNVTVLLHKSVLILFTDLGHLLLDCAVNYIMTRSCHLQYVLITQGGITI